MALVGTSAVGKPINLLDNVTVSAEVVSTSETFVTLTLANSEASVTVDVRDLCGPTQDNGVGSSLVAPPVGAQVTFNGQVTSATGDADQLAQLVIQMRFPTTLDLTSSPPFPVTTVTVSAYDCINSQTL